MALIRRIIWKTRDLWHKYHYKFLWVLVSICVEDQIW